MSDRNLPQFFFYVVFYKKKLFSLQIFITDVVRLCQEEGFKHGEYHATWASQSGGRLYHRNSGEYHVTWARQSGGRLKIP